MINDSTIKIYIDSSKPYYYPGENFAGSILLDVLEETNCDKMQIIAKGKEIVEAIQKTPLDSYIDSEDNDYSSESDDERQNNKRKSNSKNDSSSSEETEKDNSSIARKLNETRKIFKYKKILQISSKNYIAKGKYSFPFEIELPSNIPGSFLFMEKNAYVEIYYTVKVKLNKINIKEVIPIVIRQNEKLFNYPESNEYTKKIMGCCFDNNESTIKLIAKEKYMINIDDIKLNIILDNSRCDIQGSPLTVDLYQKITLFPKKKDKKMKITKLVGNYKGQKPFKIRKDYNNDIHFLMDKADYAANHLKKTKSIKYFRHKDVIPFLNQSVISDFVTCEYEAYAEVQFPNWSIEELGVFLRILIYTPEKGIISKTVKQRILEFSNSILNKKVFLTNKTKENDPEFESKNNGNNYYLKNKYYENSESEEEFKNKGKRVSIVKVKTLGLKESKKEDNNIELNQIVNRNEIDNNSVNNSVNNINNNYVNNINNNSNNNLNINEYNNEETNKVINENGSFGTYKMKKNIVFIDTNSNNIKKEFSQAYLNDPLDDEFLDKESSSQ